MYQKQKLKNGLNLILAPLKGTSAVTVLILLGVGSRHETKNINGVSHFIEHLVFKGTKKRPTSLDITKELDAVGAEYNAFTAKDHTGYFIKGPAKKIELAFDILSDMIFNSTFNSLEIDKERGVIIEEINMYNDNPLFALHGLFEQTMFDKNSLGWQISGPKKVIKQISRQKLVNYKEKFYQPENMVIVVAGSFNKTQVKNLTKKYFDQKNQRQVKNIFTKVKISQTKPKVSLMYKDTQQVQIGLGFPAFALNDPRVYPLYLLSVILGGNMSSRLFRVIREEHGLAYYIKSEIEAFQDIGLFVVQAGLDKKRIASAITLILAELKKVTAEGVTDKELKDAKEFLKGKVALQLEDSENVADWYGKQQLLQKKLATPAQRLKKISAVKAGDVKKVANQIFKAQRLTLVLIGPLKDKQTFVKLLKF